MKTVVRLIGLGGILAGAVLLAQAPVQGLSGVGGGQGGVFTIPRVEAHTLGIPGVTRPMLMAGPAGGFGGGMGGGLGGAGGGGQGGGMLVNPNWVGAAGMFMPQLLTGGANGVNGANAAGGAGGGTATRTLGVNGSRQPWTVVGTEPASEAGPVDASAQRSVVGAGVASVAAARPALPRSAAVDPAVADARLLEFQREQARQGSPSAQLALARRYAQGRGVEANPAVAKVWLEAAARSGSEEAQRELEPVTKAE